MYELSRLKFGSNQLSLVWQEHFLLLKVTHQLQTVLG